MAPVKLSEACMAIVDSIVENYGDILLSEDHANQIFGAKKEVLVKDLTTTQLLQYALVHAHLTINELASALEQIKAAKPNRAERRANKKLILPS
jgi:hypothetical protein